MSPSSRRPQGASHLSMADAKPKQKEAQEESRPPRERQVVGDGPGIAKLPGALTLLNLNAADEVRARLTRPRLPLRWAELSTSSISGLRWSEQPGPLQPSASGTDLVHENTVLSWVYLLLRQGDPCHTSPRWLYPLLSSTKALPRALQV